MLLACGTAHRIVIQAHVIHIRQRPLVVRVSIRLRQRGFAVDGIDLGDHDWLRRLLLGDLIIELAIVLLVRVAEEEYIVSDLVHVARVVRVHASHEERQVVVLVGVLAWSFQIFVVKLRPLKDFHFLFQSSGVVYKLFDFSGGRKRPVQRRVSIRVGVIVLILAGDELLELLERLLL